MIALVLAGGPVRATDRLRALAVEARLVVAADGGLRHAAALGVTPDLLVGDLDSVRDADLAAWPDLPREAHPQDKDDMDLELAVDAARDRGAREVRIVGAFGGRMDQTIAAALIAARYAREGLQVALLDGIHDARPLTAGSRFEAGLPVGTLFSLLALGGPVRIDVEAAAYPLADAVLPPGRGLGLSNRAADGGPLITVREGLALLMVEWGESVALARERKRLEGTRPDRCGSSNPGSGRERD